MAQAISNQTNGLVNPSSIGDNPLQKAFSMFGSLTGMPGYSGANTAYNQAQNTQQALGQRLAQGNVQNAAAFSGLLAPSASGSVTPGAPKTAATTTPQATTPTSAPSQFQQNLSKYNLTSIPTGYSFDASGKLTNGAGQEYQAPNTSTSAIPPANGGKAPPGMEYGPDGKLQPIGGGTATNNAQTGGLVEPPNPYTAPTPRFGSTVGAEAQIAATQTPQYQEAQKAYLDAASQLQQLQNQGAQQFARIGGSRTNLAEAQGEAGLTQNLLAGQEAALTGQMQAAAQSMAAATGQQQVQQQGLLGAGGLLSPQLAGPTNVPFYPGQGGTSSSGYGTPAAGAYGGGGIASVGGLNTQIQQGAAVQQMTGQQSQAQALAKNLTGLLNQAGINPTMPGGLSALQGIASQLTQWIDKQTGDPRYQNYANLISEISSRYANILNQSGGTPTDQSTLSHQIINGLASGRDLQTVLSQLDQNATDSINALKGSSQTNSAAGNNSATSNATGKTISVGGYNYTQNADGTWVPA